MMRFDERSSPGSRTRYPKPEIIFDPGSKFLLVATSWGSPEAGRRTARAVADYFLSSRNDEDATSPFRRLEHLSTTANNLRIAGLVASEMLYREENKTEYRCGIELFAACQYEQELSFVQVGQPSVILSRPGQGLVSISTRLGLSGEISTPGVDLPPLPSQLLGVNSEPDITVLSFRPQKGDQILLLNRSWIPAQLLGLPVEGLSIESAAASISSEERPYWLGLWTL